MFFLFDSDINVIKITFKILYNNLMNILLRKDYTKFVNYWLISAFIPMIGLINCWWFDKINGLWFVYYNLGCSQGNITPLMPINGMKLSLYKQIPQYYLLNLDMTM